MYRISSLSTLLHAAPRDPNILVGRYRCRVADSCRPLIEDLEPAADAQGLRQSSRGPASSSREADAVSSHAPPKSNAAASKPTAAAGSGPAQTGMRKDFLSAAQPRRRPKGILKKTSSVKAEPPAPQSSGPRASAKLVQRTEPTHGEQQAFSGTVTERVTATAAPPSAHQPPGPPNVEEGTATSGTALVVGSSSAQDASEALKRVARLPSGDHDEADSHQSNTDRHGKKVSKFKARLMQAKCDQE